MAIRHIATALTFCVSALLGTTNAIAATYSSAIAAYNQGRVEAARKEFEIIRADAEQPAKDRASAARSLARIAWLVDGKGEVARKELLTALRIGSDACATRVLFARIMRESGHPRRAVGVAADESSCADRDERDHLFVQRAWALLDLASTGNDIRRSRLLARARAALSSISPIGALGSSASALRLEIALLDSDPAAAVEAWRSYFWLSQRDAPQALEQMPIRDIFSRGLARGAEPKSESELVDLLLRAGFDKAARAYARQRRLAVRAKSEVLYRKAQLYFAFREGLEKLILRQNRLLAKIGKEDQAALETVDADFERELAALSSTTASALSQLMERDETASPFTFVSRTFNLGAMFGRTGGYPSAHVGHVIQNETQTVRQFGEAAEVKFIVYDRMISNGFESWLWDGRAQTGGFARANMIVQVRESYARSTLRSALQISDPTSRQIAEEQAADRSARDVSILADAEKRGMRVVHLPGLASRLELQAIGQIARDVGNRDEATFPLRFTEAKWRATVEHSIWIHEGRHALDASHHKAKAFSGAELEFRAKLAEILLSFYPRLALAAINDATVGSETPHGIANRRILEAYRTWIEANEDLIADYEPGSASLLQLDKLSDQQLRSVAADLADFDTAEMGH